MYAENNGVKIWYEVHGHGEPTLVMVPSLQISYSQIFKRSYIPFLSRHMRVVTLDLRGSGRSDRPKEGYNLETYVEDIDAIVRAVGLQRFAMAGISPGAPTSIKYNAKYRGMVHHLILLGGYAAQIRVDDYPQGVPRDSLEAALQKWKEQPEAMLKNMINMNCPGKYALRTKELMWEWAHETSPEIWGMGFDAVVHLDVREHLEQIDIPVLIVHAKKDKVVFATAAEYLNQKVPGSKLIYIPEGGHGFTRTWPQVARHMLDFLKPGTYADSGREKRGGQRKVLWLCSAIGLGHMRRDLAIATEMREMMPDLAIHWLSVDPVRSFLEAAGEEIHPLSDALWNESAHFEGRATAHCLDAMEALWEMDTILANNFMVFTDAVRGDGYNLVVGDEAWEVVENLHYNPALKTAPFVFMTDFVGASNVSDDPGKQAHVYNFNGTFVDMHEVHPEVSNLSIFIGELEDLQDRPFGEGLPNVREWTKNRFKFSGYVLPFDPADYSDRYALREELGFSREDRILLVAVGGTSVGRPLIEKCLQAHSKLRETVPGVRTIVLCGPRIDPAPFGLPEGVEFQPLLQDPTKYYAACDLAVIQGGLSTSMELTALGRPFLYFPLKDHFEQRDHVDARVKRYGAGVRMEFDHTSPSELAEAIAANIGRTVDYRPVETDGAQKAASMILEILHRGEAS